MEGFLKISQYAGMRNDISQAGGGNSSVKLDNNIMLIKSSGYRLSDICENNGYSKVNLKHLRNGILDNYKNNNFDFDDLLTNSLLEGQRASIETFIHVLTRKYTLHAHPTLVCAMMIQSNYENILKNIFEDLDYLSIKYVKPGIEIAKQILEFKDILKTKIQIVFLQNHGIIISADDYNDVIKFYELILLRLAEYFGLDTKKYHNITKLSHVFRDHFVYLYDEKIDNIPHYEYFPDNIVYLGKKIENFNFDIKDFNKNTKVLFLDNYLYFLANSYKKAKEMEEIVKNIILINKITKKNNLVFLKNQQIDDLLNRDDEKYRQML